MEVTFLSPEPPGNAFWDEVISFMRAVAEDLGLQLTVKTTRQAGTYVVKRLGIRAVVDVRKKPDYVLTGYWHDATSYLLEETKNSDVRYFIFNNDITPSERETVGRPRGKYPNWIGHMSPDEVHAGYQLTDILIKTARSSGTSTVAGIAALGATETSIVSIDRLKGFNQRVKEEKKLRSETINASWQRYEAQEAMSGILRKFPDINVIWTVADTFALDGIEMMKKQDLQPGKNIFVAGFDWSPEGLQAVKNGEMAATMDGHFMEGGWALIQLYDYHHGIDFKNDPGVESTTHMQAVTRNNVDNYFKRLGDRNWRKINFRKFSKTYNPELKKYDFSLDAILNSLNSSD